MEEKVTVTDKEHTYLVLKWGIRYLKELYYLWAWGASGLTELEIRAAKLGNIVCKEEDEALERALAEEIRKEIDRELIDSLHALARDNKRGTV